MKMRESIRLALWGVVCIVAGHMLYGRVGALCAVAYIFAGYFATEAGRAHARERAK